MVEFKSFVCFFFVWTALPCPFFLFFSFHPEALLTLDLSRGTQAHTLTQSSTSNRWSKGGARGLCVRLEGPLIFLFLSLSFFWRRGTKQVNFDGSFSHTFHKTYSLRSDKNSETLIGKIVNADTHKHTEKHFFGLVCFGFFLVRSTRFLLFFSGLCVFRFVFCLFLLFSSVYATYGRGSFCVRSVLSLSLRATFPVPLLVFTPQRTYVSPCPVWCKNTVRCVKKRQYSSACSARGRIARNAL